MIDELIHFEQEHHGRVSCRSFNELTPKEMGSRCSASMRASVDSRPGIGEFVRFNFNLPPLLVGLSVGKSHR